jgi:hypothetical protein
MIKEMGRKWSKIAREIPGRNEHSVKNEYRRMFRRKYREMQVSAEIKEQLFYNYLRQKVDMLKQPSDTDETNLSVSTPSIETTAS